MTDVQMLARESRMTPTNEISEHPDNANRGDIAVIKESIRVNGFYSPVIAQESTGYVIAGNHRLRAALELGIPEIPVVWLDVDDEQATRIMIVDNRSTRLGYDDTEALSAALSQLVESEVGLLGTGFSHKDMQELLIFNDTPLDLPPEPHLAGAGSTPHSRFIVTPDIDDDQCFAIDVNRADGLELSPEDYNAIREALGLGRATETEWRKLGVASWR